MFVDELEIYAKAGDGGDGVVRWRHEKFRPKAGPAGGDGGNGGDVYVRAVRDLNQLAKYTGDKNFIAENGGAGRGLSQFGKNSEDLYIDIPVGSRVTDISRDRSFEMTKEGETILILKGGQGGYGNEHFKSSTNRSPEESTKGKPGEEGTFKIEVLLMADVGLVGLPNAGKSTLLNTFTNAHSAIGAYPFTTLEPHLGVLRGFVLADIPGLIEGAADGKGLGHKFLRHIERTAMVLHLVSLENEDPMASYQEIRQELSKYSQDIVSKDEWIVLTKIDTRTPEEVAAFVTVFRALGKPVFAISAPLEEGTKELGDELVKHLRNR
jgi:GTP-binding protein